MALVSDNFQRANGPIGSNWTSVIPFNADNPPTFAGGILINGNGYGPINASGGDAAALWAGGQSFGNDQWASAVINSVAGYNAVLSITAATASGGNVTYTYTFSSGSVASQISGGALYVIISGMQNSGNNGHFTATTFGAGTFTVANASGVTEAGSSGTGNCPSDSGAGVMVRGSGASGANMTGYFFHVGSNSFNGDGRVAFKELWKIVNGTATILNGSTPTTPLTVGDNIGLSVVGSTVTAFYNGVQLFQVTDASIPSGGVPGITSWSINGSGEYLWSTWTTQTVAAGNNGTTLKNFTAGDTSVALGQLAADSFLGGPSVTQLVSDAFAYSNGDLHTQNANWAYENGTFQVSSNKCFGSSGGGLAYRSDVSANANQYAQVTAVVTGSSGVQNCGPAVRVSTSANTAYFLQYASDLFTLRKVVAGTVTTLASSSSFPANGDILAIYAIGSLIVVTKNGLLVMSASDAAIASGNVGLSNTGSSTTNGFSSFSGGNLTALFSSNFAVGTNQQFLSDTTNGVLPLVLDSNNYSSLWQNIVSWPANQYSRATLTGATISGVDYSGVGVRISPSVDTAVFLAPQPTPNINIVRFVNGVQTVLATAAYTFHSGDVFQLEVQGPFFNGFVNGVPLINAVDTAVSSGNAGIICKTKGTSSPVLNTYENWSGGSITQPSSGSFSASPSAPVVVSAGPGNNTPVLLFNNSLGLEVHISPNGEDPVSLALGATFPNFDGVNPVGPADAAFSVFPQPNRTVKIGDVRYVNSTSTSADVAQNLISPQASPVAVNRAVTSASDVSVGGKQIPGTSITFKSPA